MLCVMDLRAATILALICIKKNRNRDYWSNIMCLINSPSLDSPHFLFASLVLSTNIALNYFPKIVLRVNPKAEKIIVFECFKRFERLTCWHLNRRLRVSETFPHIFLFSSIHFLSAYMQSVWAIAATQTYD